MEKTVGFYLPIREVGSVTEEQLFEIYPKKRENGKFVII
jgi:hypothetical protein